MIEEDLPVKHLRVPFSSYYLHATHCLPLLKLLLTVGRAEITWSIITPIVMY